MPDFDAFKAAARLALKEWMEWSEGSPELAAFDTKGSEFNFYIDGGVDSLDMLDIAFSIDKQLNVHTNFDAMAENNTAITLKNLFDTIQSPEPVM